MKSLLTSSSSTLFSILALGCISSTTYSAESCPEKSLAQYEIITSYIASKYHLSAQAHLRIKANEVANESCYRRLTLEGDGPLGSYQLRLFVSPDLRFVSSDLFDSKIDPEQESRDAARKAMGKLLQGEFASRGSSVAPVTLVVFSDFECPYCKQFSLVLSNEPLIRDGKNVQVVFRHLPIKGHPWAAQAAKAAACAQFQNPNAFWSLHDALFESQSRITADNAEQQITKLASSVKSLNMGAFRRCIDQEMSLGVVIRDADIGNQVGVRGTPTIFLNGEELSNSLDPSRFHEALLQAIGRSSQMANTHSDELGIGR